VSMKEQSMTEARRWTHMRCPVCEGFGEILEIGDHGYAQITIISAETCKRCDGRGIVERVIG
jgi:DnaJ-class molecular chaperone